MKKKKKDRQTTFIKFLHTKGKYTQDWRIYNMAKCNEKRMFLRMLFELCSIIPERKRNGRGRPPVSLRDMIFCCCLKVYYTTSVRNIMSDVELMLKSNYISFKPAFTTIIKHFNNPDLEPILKDLIVISAMPLKALEKDFTVDSSGFSARVFSEKWLNIRNMKNSRKRMYRKAHVMSGVNTNIISAVEVTKGTSADSPQFKHLVEATSKNFNMKEVSGDLAYSSKANLSLVSQLGAIPYIPFKKNVTGKARGSYVWSAMFRYFHDHKDEFLLKYHKRSNSESVWAMIKRHFGDFLFTRNEQAQINEILCKILCHNICVLIQEIFESGVSIDFNLCSENYVEYKKG